MASTTDADISLSQLSLRSEGSQTPSEDWDRSMSEDGPGLSHTPRNSVTFPAGVEGTPGKGGAVVEGLRAEGRRTLSELLRAYAADGSNAAFSTEEAGRVAEVLGQWINSDSAPYESEDTFFNRSQDDSSILSRASPAPTDSRPRGQSESVVSKS